MKSFTNQIFWLLQFLALGSAFQPLYPLHGPTSGPNVWSPLKTLLLKEKTPLTGLPPGPERQRILVRRGNPLLTIAQLTSVNVAEEFGGNLEALGYDSLVFLISAIIVVPVFKLLRLSPILGFLGVGCAFGPYGLKFIKDLEDLNVLAEFGILFLLFEQGLELSLNRIRVLSKFAFGLGFLQVALSTLAFSLFPFIGGVNFLEFFFKSPDGLVNISDIDEALIIGAALSLSSSAFVLKILQEKGQMEEKYGQAALGVLLFQDIATVPLLVLLPIIENQQGGDDVQSLLGTLGAVALKAVGGLAGILLVGRLFFRRVFEFVAGARSAETFLALTLITAVGSAEITNRLGLSTSLGAFIAGALLAETNYRTQIEADLQPIRGLLLGLFFMTTGASVDPSLVLNEWPTTLALLMGLIAFKSFITSALGVLFGLSPSESVRTGVVLSGGGEFAFVILTLAQRLDVLPIELNKLLVGVVVLSMALTPVLSQIGELVGDFLQDQLQLAESKKDMEGDSLAPREHSSGVIVVGFGPVGQVVATMISTPVVRQQMKLEIVAFDLDPKRVSSMKAQGFQVYYGDGSQTSVLETAGIRDPKAFVVTYSDKEQNYKAVARLKIAFPNVPILTRASDFRQYWKAKEAGASTVVSEAVETSLSMGSSLLEEFQIRSDGITALKGQLRESLAEIARTSTGDITQTFFPSFLNPKEIAARADVRVEDLGVSVCILPEEEGSEGGSSGSEKEISEELKEMMKTMSSAKSGQKVSDNGAPVVWDKDSPFVTMPDEKRIEDERAVKK